MNTLTDQQLLRDYSERQSEPAFSELVRRHVDFVYSAALRMVRDSALAQDITQGVFLALAQNAGKLADRPVLAGWLHRTTQNLSVKAIRSETRRHAREQQAAAMNELFTNEPDATWEHIAPHLDVALSGLTETDRDALLLRYFQRQSAREIGQALGVSEDAAQKRVNRAIERLREFFAKRGITIAASSLVLVLSTNAVQSAPLGLATTLSSAAVVSTAKGAGTITLLKAMAMSKLKIGVISAVVVASAVTTTIIYQQDQTAIRNTNAKLEQQKEQLAQSQTEQKRLSNLLVQAKTQHPNNPEELDRLRNEAATLRKQAEELAALQKQERQLQSVLTKARQDLRAKDTNQQETVASVELPAKMSYAMALNQALWEYASKHQSRFPTNLEQAAEFIRPEARNQTNLSLNQFEMVYQGTTTGIVNYAHPDRIILVKERQPWKNSDGKWVMAWTSLRGQGTVYSPADGNFDAWVKQHTIAAEAP